MSQSSAESKAPGLASCASSKENQNAGAVAATATKRAGASVAREQRAEATHGDAQHRQLCHWESVLRQYHREVVEQHVQRVIAVARGCQYRSPPSTVARTNGGTPAATAPASIR